MATPWSSKGSKATPVDADELLIIDSADANPATTNKLITIGSMPFVANPLSADLDADGNALLDANYVEVGSSLAGNYPASGQLRIKDLGEIVWNNSSDDGTFSIVSDDPTITFNGFETIEFADATAVDFQNSPTIAGISTLQLEGGGSLELQDSSITGATSIQSSNTIRTDNVLNLGNTELISWEKAIAANGAIALSTDSSDNFVIQFSPSSVGAFTTEFLFSNSAGFNVQGHNILEIQNLVHDQTSITFAASTDLNFNLDTQQTVSLTGDITFTTSNLVAGKSKILRIISDGSARTFTFPSWVFIGAAAPANIAANKTAILSLSAWGAADTDIVATYEVEP